MFLFFLPSLALCSLSTCYMADKNQESDSYIQNDDRWMSESIFSSKLFGKCTIDNNTLQQGKEIYAQVK